MDLNFNFPRSKSISHIDDVINWIFKKPLQNKQKNIFSKNYWIFYHVIVYVTRDSLRFFHNILWRSGIHFFGISSLKASLFYSEYFPCNYFLLNSSNLCSKSDTSSLKILTNCSERMRKGQSGGWLCPLQSAITISMTQFSNWKSVLVSGRFLVILAKNKLVRLSSRIPLAYCVWPFLSISPWQWCKTIIFVNVGHLKWIRRNRKDIWFFELIIRIHDFKFYRKIFP